ncbi:MAG TPA: BsuPI-related putative proteinase inhibitor [Nitrospiria bacterium]|nr:BsuPI-related putative proteinase inhibitor [Nitrospiria bacterium]
MSAVSNTFYRLILICIGFFLLLLAGNVSSFGGEEEKALRLLLAINKQVYTKSDLVELALMVTNTTGHPERLSFSSAKQYDFVIKQGGQELWRWSNGKSFAMVLTSITLDPRESRQFQVSWGQTDRTGKQIEPGFYEAVGSLEVRNNMLSNPIAFEIRN